MDAALGLATIFGLATLVVVPPLVLRARFGAGWRWFLLGVASWGAALAVKSLVHAAVLDASPGASAFGRGATSGVLSAVTELGMAALFLRHRQRLADVLAFGVGIGCFEIVFKVTMGVAGAQDTDAASSASDPAAVTMLLSLVEHASTVAGHAATRALVYLACAHRRVAPAVVALTTFSLVDGMAAYGWADGWRWETTEVYAPVVGFVMAVASVEVSAARMFWRRLEVPGATDTAL